MEIVNVRITHKDASVPILELASFPNVEKALREITSIDSIKECVILQTCNRVEVYAASPRPRKAIHDITDYIMSNAMMKIREGFERDEKMKDGDIDELISEVIRRAQTIHDCMRHDIGLNAVRHLFRIACGLESMIIGEDQILGQVKDFYNLAKRVGTVGDLLDTVFCKAIQVGKRARRETQINKGAVSIASAAVELAESLVGRLSDKKVMLIGAGEMGTLAAKSLKEKKVRAIIVANRTYERGKRLAEELGGMAVRFEQMDRYMAESDIVISATGAPHPIITKEIAERVLEIRKELGIEEPLLIIDIANPRDVEDDVAELNGVIVKNIDDLREIAEKNKMERMKEIPKVEQIIEEEISRLKLKLARISVEPIIARIMTCAEEIRRREVEKAMRMLGNVDGREREIIENLSRVLVNRLYLPIIKSLREAAECGDAERIETIEKTMRWI